MRFRDLPEIRYIIYINAFKEISLIYQLLTKTPCMTYTVIEVKNYKTLHTQLKLSYYTDIHIILIVYFYVSIVYSYTFQKGQIGV